MQPALGFDAYRTQRRLPALDGIRALAVLLVISWHVHGGAFIGLHGDFGVQIFFVLSGFLITTLALREESLKGRFSLPPFLVRRAFRILPLFWLCIAVYAVAELLLQLDGRGSAYRAVLPWYLGYLPEIPVFRQHLHPGSPEIPFASAWSLGIEEKFYLVWPAIAFVLLRGRSVLVRALVGAGGVATLWVFHVAGPAVLNRYLFAYEPILLGCLAALALSRPRTYRWAASLTSAYVVVPALAVAIALQVSGATGGLMLALHLLTVLLVLAVVLRPTSVGARLLAHRVPARIGVLSYALYLFHGLVLNALEKVLPSSGGLPMATVMLLAAVVVSVPLCEVLHRGVERPLQEWGRQLARRLEARHAPAVSIEIPQRRNELQPPVGELPATPTRGLAQGGSHRRS